MPDVLFSGAALRRLFQEKKLNLSVFCCYKTGIFKDYVSTTPLLRSGFADIINVSRETLDKLQIYLDLLERWNCKINLVGTSTLKDPWRRHFLDSAQLAVYVRQPVVSEGRMPLVVDLGSGAGFPGLVLSIMGVARVVLVESDQRKVAFLREVVRAVCPRHEIKILAERCERTVPLEADYVTARAFSPLFSLFLQASRHLQLHGRGIFLKGRQVKKELDAVPSGCYKSIKQLPSISNSQGSVVVVDGLVNMAMTKDHKKDNGYTYE